MLFFSINFPKVFWIYHVSYEYVIIFGYDLRILEFMQFKTKAPRLLQGLSNQNKKELNYKYLSVYNNFPFGKHSKTDIQPFAFL